MQLYAVKCNKIVLAINFMMERWLISVRGDTVSVALVIIFNLSGS